MENPEQEHPYYYPTGTPVTPTARRFGYEFPVYVSNTVWHNVCTWIGGTSRVNTHTDKRIFELLQYCYEGMMKKLTQDDGFVAYEFKVWYWRRFKPEARKKGRARLGARLFLIPETGGPWLFIYDPNGDSLSDLDKGPAPKEEDMTEGKEK